VFIARSAKDDLLLTKNLVPGDTVYNEKKVSVDVSRGQGWAASGGAV